MHIVDLSLFFVQDCLLLIFNLKGSFSFKYCLNPELPSYNNISVILKTPSF